MAELALRHVTCVGRVPPADIHRFYADADIYVQTPDIDNMPSSLLEAFSSGTPSVSTEAGGVPAIVRDGVDGLLAPVGDHHAVADCILRLLREPDLAVRLATAARDRCEQCTWRRVRSRWLELYRNPTVPDVKKVMVSDLTPRDVKKVRISDLTPGLRAMEAREMRWRAATLLRRALRRLAAFAGANKWRRRDLASRLAPRETFLRPAIRHLRRGDWMAAHRELMRHFQSRPPRFVLDPASRQALVAAVTTRFPSAWEDAQRRATRVLEGRYDLLGYTGLAFDHPTDLIDWKLDPVHGRRTADAWWAHVDYLYPVNGDHKIVWELNRHQHWITLGRAYWLTGDEQYRSRFVSELTSWLAQNRPLVGVNWASMLELGLRGLSWLWALHFFLDDPYDVSPAESDSPWMVDLLLGLDRQMQHVEENLSHYFSPDTHLTGEALALYVVGRGLPELRASGRWETLGRRVLIEQAARQIAPDGGHVERSTHYHRYTLDFYLLALAVARKTGDSEAAAAFEPMVARLARFAWAMADGNGILPRIGDDDGGTLFRMGGESDDDIRASLSVAASLLPGQVPMEELAEESLWIAASAGTDATGSLPAGEWERSIAFPSTGYYVSRSRSGDHLVFDAGPHGFLNGGHAHADSLAVTLSLRWHRFLIDTGTATYTMDASKRDRFRSTALHNTVVLDGVGQSLPDGPFHWQSVANGRAVRWASNPRFDFVEGTHDGYSPGAHRRAVFSAGGDLWLVVDHILGAGAHDAAVHWHLDPQWDVRVETSSIEARHPDGPRAVLASTAKRLDVFRGDDETGLGWCSPTYGRVIGCAAARFTRNAEAPFSIATLVIPDHDACSVRIEPIPVSGGQAGAYAFGVRVVRPDAIEMGLFAVPADETAVMSLGTAGTWQFGDLETDARFAYVRLGLDGAVQAVALVDGTFVQRLAHEPFRLHLDRPARDVWAAVEPDGLLDIFSSGSLSSLGLDGAQSDVTHVRLNDAAASFSRIGSALVVPSGQRGAPMSQRSEQPTPVR